MQHEVERERRSTPAPPGSPVCSHTHPTAAKDTSDPVVIFEPDDGGLVFFSLLLLWQPVGGGREGTEGGRGGEGEGRERREEKMRVWREKKGKGREEEEEEEGDEEEEDGEAEEEEEEEEEWRKIR